MSLFDLQDVCIVIGSLATLDIPMVVDLIGIYVLKGPYCTLTTTNWFLQALSVIPRGSWRDVARRFTMIRWATPEFPVNLVGARRLDASKVWSREVSLGTPFQTRHSPTDIVAGDGQSRKRKVVECVRFIASPSRIVHPCWYSRAVLFIRAGIREP
ncbi:tetratricopeptide repeat protein 7A [Dorcoceras hygrometricum]|uniref:Tetratricopeptide repeat protein 7A n=1 Tax=Dorcoceras hygrometricum TaxID=472368 RepID=A0A2Z7D667_9LAMI|nr:tetratricopeptide repeat protein 7A [Dorcoceras hygrometricum]